jgi:uncharacterized protein
VKASSAAALLPRTLQIYFTNRCNLDCTYCSSRRLREQDRRTLPLESVLRAVDLYVSRLRGAACSVNFTGGEPLLAYDTLSAAVDRIRRDHPKVEPTLVTNGTLLEPGPVASLLDRGVRISVSLDGDRAANDLQRRFKDSGASVFDEVERRLARLPKAHVARLDAEVTLTKATLPSLPSSIAYLSGAGFHRICLNFDMLEPWGAPALAALEKALAALRRQALQTPLFSAGRRKGALFFETNKDEGRRAHITRSIVLSPDGRFYPCNAACTQGLPDFQIGDLERGLDLGRLRRIYGSALAALPEDHADSLYSYLNRLCHALALGRDPAAMVAGGCRAGRIVSQELGGLKTAERVLERLDKDPHFGDFGHEPRYRSKKELPSLRLAMGSGLPDELAKLRQAADFCLYSKGQDKTLLLAPKDPKASFPLVEGISLYSRLKAKKLKKNLSLRLLADASSLSEEQVRFLDDHDVLHSGGAPARALPLGLDLYVTRRCNLACDYCSSKGFIAERRESRLSAAQMRRAVDLFAGQAAADPAPVRTVSFTGGEPLLEYPAVAKTIDHIRSAHGRGLELYLFTNGTLLGPEKAAFLLKRDVHIVVSLDGPKAVNDRHRRFRGGGPASVHGAVLRRLRRLPSAVRRRLHLMATFTSATIGSLIACIEFFKRLEPADIHLGLDVYESWSPEGLKRLRRSLGDVRRYSTAEAGWSYRPYFKDKLRASDDEVPSNSLCLSPEGLFFPCDELCVCGRAGAPYAVGDIRTGVHLGKLARVYSEAASFISRYDRVDGALSPIDRYFRALLSGGDPASALRNSGEVTQVFEEELGCLVDLERILKRLARDPHFGDFDHEPKYRSRKELPFLRLPMGSGLEDELARLRQAADFCLYSPGRDKTLLLAPADPRASFHLVEGIALYSLLKARALKKRLRLLLRGDAAPLSEEQRRFLDDHAVLHGRALLRSGWKPPFSGFLKGVP